MECLAGFGRHKIDCRIRSVQKGNTVTLIEKIALREILAVGQLYSMASLLGGIKVDQDCVTSTA